MKAAVPRGRQRTAWSLLWATVSMLAGPAMAADGFPPLQIPAHEVPVPDTVSPQLRQRIAQHLAPATPAEPPATNAAWNALYNPDPPATRKRIDTLLREQKLAMVERLIGGVHCYEITPTDMPATHRRRILLNMHGGGYVGGAGEAGLNEALFLASIGRFKVIAIDYRMPPEHPYPAPVDDAMAVWRDARKTHAAADIGLFGTSAGGAMALTIVQRLVSGREAVPGAVVAGTPWADLSETGDSYFVNRFVDPVQYRGSLGLRALQYAAGRDLKDPGLSPIYGRFDGFPPVLILSGTRDILLSNAARVDRALRDAGRDSSLIVYEGQSHGRYLSGLDIAETRTAMRDMTIFFDRHLGR